MKQTKTKQESWCGQKPSANLQGSWWIQAFPYIIWSGSGHTKTIRTESNINNSSPELRLDEMQGFANPGTKHARQRCERFDAAGLGKRRNLQGAEINHGRDQNPTQFSTCSVVFALVGTGGSMVRFAADEEALGLRCQSVACLRHHHGAEIFV